MSQVLNVDGTSALELVAAEIDRATTPCITSSFQAEDVILLHMLLQVKPDIPVLVLDTVPHFPLTNAYRDELTTKWGLNLMTLRAAAPEPGLWQQDYKACCDRHKVGPLFAALDGYDTWFTGLRRDQSPTRAGLQEVEPFTLPTGKVLRKVSALAHWHTRDVWAYAQANSIPLLPLYDLGYTSIGCEPCTTIPGDPGNDRSGRWQGQKLECGIHIEVKAAE
jgi:phosphoadenosine phosphosulfate reductase